MLERPWSCAGVLGAGSGYNATLWVLLDARPLACFRVSADRSGRVCSVSVSDFGPLDGNVDQVLRTKLVERYGEHCEILVQVDGGAGFERFHRGFGPELPKSPAGPGKQQSLGL
jgi:hypothetical protein